MNNQSPATETNNSALLAQRWAKLGEASRKVAAEMRKAVRSGKAPSFRDVSSPYAIAYNEAKTAHREFWQTDGAEGFAAGRNL